MRNKPPNITIIDREPGFPYSKGHMANRMMVTGLSPLRSYQVAERIEDMLLERDQTSITSDELSQMAIEVLDEVAGERYAKNYIRWRTVEQLDVPMVILIGGATGVGKSTIATQMAARLGIVRVVPTDAIREVMRALFSHELMPTLYTSSFEAGAVLREPPSRPADKTIVGFREQTAAVAVGVRGLMERSAVEGMSTVIEGAHLVPGFLEASPFTDRALIVPMVVTVEDETVHRNHFVARSTDASARPFNRYLDGFEDIRKVQKYIKSQALSHDWPVIPNYNLDQALSSAMDLVVDRATERAATAAERPVPALEGGNTP